MTSIEADVEAAVSRLARAVSTARPCEPLRDLINTGDIRTAYAVQEAGIDALIRNGARRIGRKIGLTSPVVQAQLGVDSPDFGTLLDYMRVEQDEPVLAGRLLQARIEAEVAFVLAADITTTNPTAADVAAAIATAHPALEIVDSRIAEWDISLIDTVADNASSGLFVVGTGIDVVDVDTDGVQMELLRDDMVVSTGSGAACLGGPLRALQWLARTAVEFGRPLRAGEIVLSGALGPMVPVAPGESYLARMSGLGEVRAIFAAADVTPHATEDAAAVEAIGGRA
jgi:2-keto-4-pentenoate hydratase